MYVIKKAIRRERKLGKKSNGKSRKNTRFNWYKFYGGTKSIKI